MFMKRWKERISRWKFDRKMQALVIISITFTTLIVLIVSTVSSVTSLKDKSIELLQDKNATLAENYQNKLEDYKAAAIALVIDGSVQRYLKCSDKHTLEYALATTEANNVLSSSLNMSSDTNFIAVISYQMDDYLYRGKDALAASEFHKSYAKDLDQCMNGQDSTLKIGFSNAYYKGEQYTVNVYFPIYSLAKVHEERGLLCMNFSNTVLNQIVGEETAGQKTEVVSTDGTVVAAGDTEKMGTAVDYTNLLGEEQGSFYEKGRLYVYRKVHRWNFYIISSIASIELYRPSIRMICVMIGILLVLVAVCYVIVKKIIQRVYQPLDRVVQNMDDVAAGSLSVRMDAGYMGEDFAKLATGFNSMMEEILVLMEQVKQEQHQIEQIRFNSLQSQIQPHFLYNCLDSITWLLRMEKNKEADQMLTALSSLFRIALSKGREIISIGDEILHVTNYLLIQNIIYSKKLSYEISCSQSVYEYRTLKLLLQPLVENSISHARPRKGERVHIQVSVYEEGRCLVLSVRDSGIGLLPGKLMDIRERLSHPAEEDGRKNGYGLYNVNERIQILLGKDYGVHIRSVYGEGTWVYIRIPKVKGEEEFVQGNFM